MLKSVRRQRVVDQAQVQTVDPMPEKNGKNDLPAEIEAEEAGMKLGEVYQWHHEPTADNRQHGAKEESFGEIPPFRIPPRQEVMERKSEDDGEDRSEEHTSELQSHVNLVCRLLLEKKKKI